MKSNNVMKASRKNGGNEVSDDIAQQHAVLFECWKLRQKAIVLDSWYDDGKTDNEKEIQNKPSSNKGRDKMEIDGDDDDDDDDIEITDRVLVASMQLINENDHDNNSDAVERDTTGLTKRGKKVTPTNLFVYAIATESSDDSDVGNDTEMDDNHSEMMLQMFESPNNMIHETPLSVDHNKTNRCEDVIVNDQYDPNLPMGPKEKKFQVSQYLHQRLLQNHHYALSFSTQFTFLKGNKNGISDTVDLDGDNVIQINDEMSKKIAELGLANLGLEKIELSYVKFTYHLHEFATNLCFVCVIVRQY